MSGFDDDLAGQITATSNRIRGPADPDPPRVGTRPRTTAGSPGGAGPTRNLAHPIRSHGCREDLGAREAVEEGTASRRAGSARRSSPHSRRRPSWSPAPKPPGPGPAAAGCAARSAASATGRGRQKVEELVAAHPLSKVLMTMPGVGVWTCARILTEVARLGPWYSSVVPLTLSVMPSPATESDHHQRPRVESRQPLQPRWLAQRYVVDKLSTEEIAEQCGWSSQYVRGPTPRLRNPPPASWIAIPPPATPGPRQVEFPSAAGTIGETDQPANRVQHLWGS